MASSVEILCPNGHRQTVKTQPNTSLIQVLEEVCSKKGFHPSSQYELKHGRKTLDLTLTVRYAGLANRAKLELVKAATERAEEDVQLVIQTPSGERVQHSFPTSSNLWDILTFWDGQKTGGELTKPKGGEHTVCIYIRNEVIGEYALRNTSLKQIGATNGKILIRVAHRSVDEATLANISANIDKEMKRLERMNAKASASNTSSPNISQQNHPSGQSSAVEVQHSIANEPTPEQVMTPNVETPMEVEETPSSHDTKCQQEKISHSQKADNDFQREQRAMARLLPGMHISPSSLSSSAASTSGTSRGHMSHAAAPVSDVSPFANFKFPEATKGQELYKNEYSEYKKEDYMPCERQALVYSLDAVTAVEPHGMVEEPSDDFFELTKADFQKLYNDIKAQQQGSDAPLMTNSMRLAQKEARMDKHPHSVIRVHFPDRHVLQGVFKPREAVHALTKFVKEHLEDKTSKFYLYTTPPRNELKDSAKSLFDADLTPLSVVYFGCECRTGPFLRNSLISSLSTEVEAQAVVNSYFARPVSAGSSSSGSSSVVPVKRHAALPSTSASSSSDAGEQKVPKWFKMGKK